MAPSTRRKLLYAAAIVGALVLLALLARWWRGPVLPGYEVAEGPLVQQVVATGRVAAPSRLAIGAEISGLVLERRVQEGDRVAPGDVLLELRADTLRARHDEAQAALEDLRSARRPDAQARLEQARAQLEQARREAERRHALALEQLVSRESAEQAAEAVTVAAAAAEQARLAAAAVAAGGPEEMVLRARLAEAAADLDKAVVRATVSGRVLTRNVEPGDVVQPGQVLLEIARDAPGELLLPVDEKHLSRLRTGQPATCIADAFPDQPFPASVSYIAPSIDPARGTLEVRLRIGEADFLREDMTVTATIFTGRSDHALVVPNDALLDVAGGKARVLAVRRGRVHSLDVQLGLRGLAASQVLDGVQAGDHVLAAAALDPAKWPADGARVRVGPQTGPSSDPSTRRESPVGF